MPLKIHPGLLLCLTASTLFSSCLTAYHQQAYYTSPFNGSSEGYHTIPLHTDSARTAFFVQGAGFTGPANDLQTDHFSGGNVSAYLAQHQGMWQGWAGFDLAAGSYSLGNWHSRYTGNNFLGVNYDQQFLPPATAKELNALSGPRTFAGAGFSGGLNPWSPWVRASGVSLGSKRPFTRNSATTCISAAAWPIRLPRTSSASLFLQR